MPSLLLWIKRSAPFAIVAISVAIGVGSLWNEAYVIDEIPHIGAGYSYLAKQDMRYNPEHPPLAKDIAALPLMMMHINDDAVFTSSYWTTHNPQEWDAAQWSFGQDLVYHSNNNVDAITRSSKAIMLVFFIAAAIVLFVWARNRYGYAIALICLTAFAFSPTVIAHSHLVTTDMPAVFGVVSASYFFVRFLQKQTKKTFLVASLFFGIALLTKFSTILLVPIFIVMALLWGSLPWKRTSVEILRSTLQTCGLTLLMMLAGYGVVTNSVYWWHVHKLPAERQIADMEVVFKNNRETPLANTVIDLANHSLSRPTAHYLFGLTLAIHRTGSGTESYFFGEFSRHGSPWYFPVLYVVKESVAWICLIGLAIGLYIRQMLYEKNIFRIEQYIRNHLDEVTMLLWIGLYGTISITSTLNIGIRHILPIYPFIILLVGAGLVRAYSTNLNLRRIIIGLTGGIVLTTFAAFPYYLSYFNMFIGGSDNARKIAIDSNLDWGQDIKRLGLWLTENNIESIELDYFGTAVPSSYTSSTIHLFDHTTYKDKADFIQRNKSNGWMALSVQHLQDWIARDTETPNYVWLDTEKPIETIGHSIRIYHFEN